MAESGGLPSGIVTFVFTDIESSTRLMRRIGDRYTELSERHIEVLRRTWRQHRGHEFGTAGDSMFVAFETAAELAGMVMLKDAPRSLTISAADAEQSVLVSRLRTWTFAALGLNKVTVGALIIRVGKVQNVPF